MPVFYKWDDKDLLLNLYVQANAKNDELVGENQRAKRVRILCPAKVPALIQTAEVNNA